MKLRHMKLRRILSMLLALTMLAATACGGGGVSNDTDNADKSTDTAVETVDKSEMLELPDNITTDYKNISILTAEGTLHGPDELSDELDVLQQAMYERRVNVEERLGFEFIFHDIASHQDAMSMARQSVASGADDFQMVFILCQFMAELVNEGIFLPLSELPHIDLDKPWWNKEYVDSVSLIEGDPYILFGDITYNMIQRTTCTFFNINLLEEKLNMKADDLYDIVRNGEWTIDKMNEMVSQVYEDANGNTKNDEDDVHGLVIWGANAMNWMAFSSGVDFTSRDEDGYPVLSLNNETTNNLVDKLINMFYHNEGVYQHQDNNGHVSKFGNGNALFLVNRFFTVDWAQLQNMEDDYGIIPCPKYSEDIDGYRSVAEQNCQWGAVPVTTVDPVFVSAVAEALAYESRKLTTPAYYEISLKLKSTRDDASMEMIDIVMDGRYTDFLFINSLGGMNSIFKNIFAHGQNTFASTYAGMETAAKATLQDLIEDFEERRS